MQLNELRFRLGRWLRAAIPCCLLLGALRADALIEVGGADPVTDPGWPPGVLAVANLPSRVSWTEGPPFGGGQWTFYYRGDTAALQQAVDALARIEPRPGVITLHGGTLGNPFEHSSRGGVRSPALNWSFEAWVPASFERLLGKGGSRLMSGHPLFGQECPLPRLDVWLAGAQPDWSRIRVPTNVTVLDLRAAGRGYSASNVTLKVTVQNTDGSPLPRARVMVETNRPGTPYHGVVHRATLDGAGTVILSNLPPGAYRVAAAASGFAPRVVAADTWSANAYQEFTTRLAPATILRGNVTDTGGAPLIGAVVGIRHAVTTNGHGYQLVNQLESTTNPFGQFELNGAPEGTVQLTAALPGYLHRGVGSLVPSPCPTNIVLQMEPTGTLEISVVDRAGRPVAPGAGGKAGTPEHVHAQEPTPVRADSWT